MVVSSASLKNQYQEPMSPAQFEALMPDPKLKQTLSAEDYAALMPDWKLLESDEPEMESSQHYMQLLLLVSCLEYLWRNRSDFFIGANLTIYYSPEQVKTRDYRGPDFFLVKNTEHKPRRSWVIWEEEYKFPNVIIELLSLSTAGVDRNLKKVLYAETFKTQEYFWFDPEKLEFKGFQLVDGAYVEIVPNAKGHLWSEELGLFLGLESNKLRYFYLTGAIVRTPEEDAVKFAADVEQQVRFSEQQAKLSAKLAKLTELKNAQVEQQSSLIEQQSSLIEQQSNLIEQRNAQVEQQSSLIDRQSNLIEQEAARADRLAQQLRSLGIEPDSI